AEALNVAAEVEGPSHEEVRLDPRGSGVQLQGAVTEGGGAGAGEELTLLNREDVKARPGVSAARLGPQVEDRGVGGDDRVVGRTLQVDDVSAARSASRGAAAVPTPVIDIAPGAGRGVPLPGEGRRHLAPLQRLQPRPGVARPRPGVLAA